jgi:hypothetical protein
MACGKDVVNKEERGRGEGGRQRGAGGGGEREEGERGKEVGAFLHSFSLSLHPHGRGSPFHVVQSPLAGGLEVATPLRHRGGGSEVTTRT